MVISWSIFVTRDSSVSTQAHTSILLFCFPKSKPIAGLRTNCLCDWGGLLLYGSMDAALEHVETPGWAVNDIAKFRECDTWYADMPSYVCTYIIGPSLTRRPFVRNGSLCISGENCRMIVLRSFGSTIHPWNIWTGGCYCLPIQHQQSSFGFWAHCTWRTGLLWLLTSNHFRALGLDHDKSPVLDHIAS